MDQGPRQTPDWVEDVKTEVTGMARDGLGHPSTAPVLTGAAIGLAAGWLVVGGPILGALAGAGVALYTRIKK
ncbi:MAG: hypothetical protein K2Q29_12530 [Sphingomonadales bacterium]|jgi:hypothetical protein|nr:hypothetical protein [Sphingomonadales bacterium]